METLNAKDFMDKLQRDTLRPACILKGLIKKSEKETEILFKPKGNISTWIKIPSSMIDGVVVKRNIVCNEEAMTVVKLILKAPTTPEASVLFDLLTASIFNRKYHKHCESNTGDFETFGNKRFGMHCSCGAHHHCNCGCARGRQSSCECSGHS